MHLDFIQLKTSPFMSLRVWATGDGNKITACRFRSVIRHTETSCSGISGRCSTWSENTYVYVFILFHALFVFIKHSRVKPLILHAQHHFRKSNILMRAEVQSVKLCLTSAFSVVWLSGSEIRWNWSDRFRLSVLELKPHCRTLKQNNCCTYYQQWFLLEICFHSDLKICPWREKRAELAQSKK